MKNKLTLVAAIALGGLMVCGPIAQAQNQPTTPPASGDGTTPPPPRRGGRGGNMMQTIFDKLNLTDDQKAKLKPVMDDTREKLRALHQDTSLSQEDRRAKGKEIMDSTDAKVKEILTPDQYTKFQELRQQNRSRGRRPGGGAGANTAPSTPKTDSAQ